jgi:peptidyl-tRNA hydrolase, PTH1 family
MQIALIVGLGNPGQHYANNRHNAGSWFASKLCDNFSASFNLSKKLQASVATVSQDVTYRIIIPNVFMNNSGSAVVSCANFYQVAPENILVVHDELDFPLGRYQFKFGGGHGGHNGLRDIMQKLGGQDFWRLRLGIGRPEFKTMVADYVLSAPSSDEQKILDQSLDLALKEFLRGLV